MPGAVGPLQALQAHLVGTLGRGRVVGVLRMQGLWWRMGGGEAREVKEEREGTSTTTSSNPPPPSLSPPPPRKNGKGKAPPRKEAEAPLPLRRPPAKTAPGTTSLRQSQRLPPPQERRGGRRRRWGVGKKRGRRRRRKGGGPPDPLVGTPAHVPYRGVVEVGTITGVHTRKSGVVWVRYPNNPKLYEVERHLIFSTAQAVQAHLQKVRKGRTPTTNPPPPVQRSQLTPRLTPKKTLNPTQIPPLTHLTPQAKPKLPRRYGTRKRAPGRLKMATMAGMAKNLSCEG